MTAAVAAAAPGSVICLNPGTYSPPSGFPANGSFAIGNAVTVQGMGANPGQVILQGSASTNQVLYFVNYIGGKTASGSTITNLTLQGSPGGIGIQDFIGSARLTDITIKDVIINTTASGGTVPGLETFHADRINIDNVTINTTSQTALYILDTTTSVIMNSTVTNAAVGLALAVQGGGNNVIVNNTFGQPKVTATYSFTNADNTVFNNTSGNRFENNVLQGQQFNGVSFSVASLPGIAANVPSTDNYVGKNTVISTGYADGLGGGTGIWSNCNADRNWIYGNTEHGAVEGGVTVWTSLSNMVLANTTYGNGIAGVMASGGAETPGDCTVLTPVKPAYNYFMSNAAFFNKNDQAFFRDTDFVTIARNFTSPRSGFGGSLFTPCVTAACQSAIGFDSNNSAGNTNPRVVANTNSENIRGFYAQATSGVEFAYNRSIQPLQGSLNLYITGGATNFDNGPATGGNYWTLFPGATADPSPSAAYGTSGVQNPALGVFYDGGLHSGLIVDRHPFKHEHMGRGHTVSMFEPRAGATMAAGTKRTVRFDAPGCVYVDVSLDGTTGLASNAPNTGYAIVTIPGATSVGAHTVWVTCKDSAGVAQGYGNVSVNVTSSALQLLAPGRDDVFNTGSTMIVAWKKSATVTTVAVDVSTNGGSTWTTPVASTTATFARVTVPGSVSAQNAMVRVRSLTTSDVDYTDGYFAVRGTSGFGFVNVPATRRMGSLERLEWTSPQNSRLVTITAMVGGVTKNVAVNLPDRGNFDWVTPEWATTGAMTLGITFMNSAGGTIITASNATSTALFPTTITFNPVQSLGIGATASLAPVASSGLAVTITNQTPSVCSVSSGNVTGSAAGTCTLTFTQAGNATYAPSQASTSFIVQADPPRLGNISTRMEVLTGGDVMIGGFIIGGSSNKTVVIRARGPSLIPFGISNALANPQLQLVRSSDQATLATNDDWGSAPNAGAISASGYAPGDPLESAILVNLPPGAYTAIVSGVGNTTGVGIVEVFEVDAPSVPLRNISTRGEVLTGNDVMIGGFIVQGSGPQQVVVRARGPSLVPFGIPNALMNPTLTLVRSSDQAVLASNDDWGTASNAAAISSSGYAPSDPAESAIMMTLNPGAYTAIVSGVGGTTGVGIVEVFTVP